MQMISVGGAWDSLQLEKLFQALAQLNKLSTLFMYSLDLNGVEPGLLAMNINKLESLTMSSCKLAEQQVQTVFETMSEATKLKKLDLYEINLSAVDHTTLATAMNMLAKTSITVRFKAIADSK